MKDVAETDGERIERIIFDLLNDLVKKGIDKKQIDSAIHKIEFHRKEITNSPYPYGIKLLLTFVGSWLHGGDPENILRLEGLVALEDWLLWCHVRETPLLLSILYLWIGLIGMGFARRRLRV